jgi:hypothetical protein
MNYGDNSKNVTRARNYIIVTARRQTDAAVPRLHQAPRRGARSQPWDYPDILKKLG